MGYKKVDSELFDFGQNDSPPKKEPQASCNTTGTSTLAHEHWKMIALAEHEVASQQPATNETNPKWRTRLCNQVIVNKRIEKEYS